MTTLDNYMFRPLLAIFRLSSRELNVLLYIMCAHTTRMTHVQVSDATQTRSKSQNPLRPQQLWRERINHSRRPRCTDTLPRQWRQLRPRVGRIKKKTGFRTAFGRIMSQTRTVLPNTAAGADTRVTLMRQYCTASDPYYTVFQYSCSTELVYNIPHDTLTAAQKLPSPCINTDILLCWLCIYTKPLFYALVLFLEKEG
jgi:hypothetical protein